MDRLLSMLSIFAGVLIVGTLLTTGFSQPDSAESLGRQLAITGLQIDPASLAIGIVAGVALCQLARICWIEIPRRLTGWLSQNMGHIGYICACAVLLAILVYA
jgi:hypothetical protein